MSDEIEYSENLQNLLKSSRASVEKEDTTAPKNENTNEENLETNNTIDYSKDQALTEDTYTIDKIKQEDFEYTQDFNTSVETNPALAKFINKKQSNKTPPKKEQEPVVLPEIPEERRDVMRSSWIADEELEKNPESFKVGVINEGESFGQALDMDETEIGLQGTNDFTDYAEKNYKKEQARVALITIAVVIVVTTAIFVAMTIMGNTNKTPEINTPAGNQQSEENNTNSGKQDISPILEYGDQNLAKGDRISTEVKEGTIETSLGNQFAISGAKIEAPYTPCLTNTSEEFCLAAEIEVENIKINTFLFNNITTSKIFTKIPKFETVEMSGFSSNTAKGGAAIGFVKLGAIDAPSIIVVFENQSGLLLSLPDDVTLETINKIVSLSKVS